MRAFCARELQVGDLRRFGQAHWNLLEIMRLEIAGKHWPGRNGNWSKWASAH